MRGTSGIGCEARALLIHVVNREFGSQAGCGRGYRSCPLALAVPLTTPSRPARPPAHHPCHCCPAALMLRARDQDTELEAAAENRIASWQLTRESHELSTRHYYSWLPGTTFIDIPRAPNGPPHHSSPPFDHAVAFEPNRPRARPGLGDSAHSQRAWNAEMGPMGSTQ
ncbi:hypothetical protein RSAG8_10165, partial [Rhizoctonia solani AG-8 WAC10335]